MHLSESTIASEPTRTEGASLVAKGLVGKGHEKQPLGEYAMVIGAFLGSCAGLVALGRKLGRELPDRPRLDDLALAGLATLRLSRLISRDKVTRVLRAPFTDVAPDAAPDQVKEKPRGEGLTRAIGELVTCPRCASVWASAVTSFGFLFFPRGARFMAGILAAAAISDTINIRFGEAGAKGGG